MSPPPLECEPSRLALVPLSLCATWEKQASQAVFRGCPSPLLKAQNPQLSTLGGHPRSKGSPWSLPTSEMM